MLLHKLQLKDHLISFEFTLLFDLAYSPFINLWSKRTKAWLVKNKHYLLRQYNIQILNKTNYLKYRTRQIKATETNK